MGRAAAVGTLVVLMLAAGCVQSEGTNTAPPPSDIVLDAEMGGVTGSVVDEGLNPIQGAQVQVSEQPFGALTDAAGAYTIGGIPQGEYTLFVAALGFESLGRVITIVPGELAELSFTLKAIAVAEPYIEVFGPYEGYFECRTGHPTTTGECGWLTGAQPHPTQLYPNDRTIFRFNLSSEDYRSIVGDMRWQQGSFATSTDMRLAFSYDKRDSSHWFCSGEGPTPLQWRYEYPDTENSVCVSKGGTDEPDRPYLKDNPMRAYANVPFGNTEDSPAYASVQQKFEVMITVFYGEPGPEGYTAFADA